MPMATDRIEPHNLRLVRARSLAAALMDEIDDVLGDYDRRAVLERLLSVLYKNGASWTTDEERARMGLEPRDELGWAPSERVMLEKRKIEAMQMIAAGLPQPIKTAPHQHHRANDPADG